ncbi:uncharacterized protein BDZ83DRAFT_597309 [Colletotrichum acutatum]|uniref:Uncharacterized protein n=1 Tax=Glomerella acutata TaxID=27357 RepID=A0AAD8XQN5_GLOAC|nr:uncharacterized protein BDZ83DRAFT_597309 [Colletotrichum acutatum]KAK1731960.1 hypothetical protein BDZ83DRAFT_597309 [Colletotrichum acutatum]
MQIIVLFWDIWMLLISLILYCSPRASTYARCHFNETNVLRGSSSESLSSTLIQYSTRLKIMILTHSLLWDMQNPSPTKIWRN